MAKEYRRLRGRIVEKYGTMSEFADRIGICRASLSAKLNGRHKISTNDIRQWAEILDIAPEEIGIYFFE